MKDQPILRRKFAVIKFWPDVKAAEDEVIARLKRASKSLNLECIVVDPFGRLLHSPHTQLTRDDVDFVLSMHFTTPKLFDIFSFVTLWNPLQFYHEWGYRKYTRHLLTHDDFLSCDSASGDDHIMRSVAMDVMREGPLFRFYPTLSEPILPPSLGSRTLCYLGINWERMSKQPVRHESLMGLLDRSGDLRIYGPKLYAGVDVWQGFQSYVGPVPFDGVSVVRLINKSGISLVLSSAAHRQSEMMSCRIFESAAAGAVIICDEHPFARRHFGESLLYIDTSLPAEETYSQVQTHLDWIKSNPERALELAKTAQDIFRKNFRLDICLEKIYAELPARKQRLECLYSPKTEEKVCLVCLMPEFRSDVLEQHIANCLAQKNVNIRGIVAMDAMDVNLFGSRVTFRVNALQAPIEIARATFVERRPDGSVLRRKPLGEVLAQVIENIEEEYFCLVAPHEQIFSDHICSLLRALENSPEAGCAWSDMHIKHISNDNKEQWDLCDDPDPAVSAAEPSIGFGRFLFRRSSLESRIRTALPYLDALSMNLLFGSSKNVPTRRCTVVTGDAGRLEKSEIVVSADLEREILVDYSPHLFQRKTHAQVPDRIQQPAPATQSVALAVAGMTEEEKTQLTVALAHSVPLPQILKKIAFGSYRLWLRMTGPRGEERKRSD